MTAVTTFPPVALDADTRKLLARTAQKAREATAERDRLVREAAAQGASLRELGDAIGMTHTGVRRILQRG